MICGQEAILHCIPVQYLITAITNVPTIGHVSTYLVAPSALPKLPTNIVTAYIPLLT